MPRRSRPPGRDWNVGRPTTTVDDSAAEDSTAVNQEFERVEAGEDDNPSGDDKGPSLNEPAVSSARPYNIFERFGLARDHPSNIPNFTYDTDSNKSVDAPETWYQDRLASLLDRSTLSEPKSDHATKPAQSHNGGSYGYVPPSPNPDQGRFNRHVRIRPSSLVDGGTDTIDSDMNNFPFLDAPGSSPGGLPRSMASPVPQQTQIITNGGGPVGGGMLGGMPPAGHQSEMRYVLELVQELSSQLARNREVERRIVEMGRDLPDRMLDRTTSSGVTSPVNGDVHPTVPALEARVADLQTQLHIANQRADSFQAEATALQSLLKDYETGFETTMQKLRPFAASHAAAITNTHRHYDALLDEERAQNLQLRLEHQEWQAGLSRVAENARLALRYANEAGLGDRRRIAKLKEERKVLRSLVGWEGPLSDDSSDEEETGESQKRDGGSAQGQQ